MSDVRPDTTHTEFSFVLHTTNFGDEYRTSEDPFTGDVTECPIDDGLTAEQAEALESVFLAHGIGDWEPDSQCYACDGDGGDSILFRSVKLEQHDLICIVVVTIIVHSLSDAVLKLVWQVSEAAKFALMSSTGDNVVATFSCCHELLERWPNAKQLESIADLRAWLELSVGGTPVRP